MDKVIFWNIINSLLAGALVFVGAFADGEITSKGLIAAASAALLVMITKFRDFWNTNNMKLFNFV